MQPADPFTTGPSSNVASAYSRSAPVTTAYGGGGGGGGGSSHPIMQDPQYASLPKLEKQIINAIIELRNPNRGDGVHVGRIAAQLRQYGAGEDKSQDIA